MRNLEPGEEVVLDSVGDTVDLARISDTPDHGSNTDVGHDDSVALSLSEQDRVRWRGRKCELVSTLVFELCLRSKWLVHFG